MHAAGEALLVRDALQKAGELSSLIVGERREDRLLVFMRDAPDHSQRRASFFREMQRVTATIAGILPPFGESSRLKVVKQRYQTARDHTEGYGERLLRDRRSPIEDPQNPGMRRSKFQLRQTPGKL